jgi:hypothetical protein
MSNVTSFSCQDSKKEAFAWAAARCRLAHVAIGLWADNQCKPFFSFYSSERHPPVSLCAMLSYFLIIYISERIYVLQGNSMHI